MPHKEMPWIRDERLILPDQYAIQVGSSAWFRWLAHTDAFCYQPPGTTNRLTLRKERHDVVVSLYDNGSGTILSTKLEVDPL